MTDSYEFHEHKTPFAGPTVVELDIPSGKIIASDDLREPDHFDVEDENYIDGAFGWDLWAKDFATKANVGYSFVGNTSPVILVKPDGIFRVVKADYDDENVGRPPYEPDDTIIASICTDHWATMITDYQYWLDHGGKTVEELNEPYKFLVFTVFDVTPGKYRWTVYSHSDGFKNHADGRVVYAQLELIEAY
jgi:hypothetical protein